jgi:CBS domain-containing protein
MQAAPATIDSGIRFDEPVKTLLRQKPHAVYSISPDAMVYEAIEQMSEKHVGSLIVLSAGRLSGIVSERDYARKVILKGKHSQNTPVSEIMSTPVLFVTPEQTLDECMRLMTSRRIRHLPVLEGETVVGMLSIGDLVNWIISSQEQTIRHLQSYIAGSYPS